MSTFSTLSYQPEPNRNGAAHVTSAEEAQKALERLLGLGLQVIDGKTEALLDIPEALASAMSALDSVHAAREALHAGGGRSLRAVLLGHATQRRRLDLQELDKLAAAVQDAEHPAVVGRSVVIAALVLLSNLDSDERWLSVLQTTHHAA